MSASQPVTRQTMTVAEAARALGVSIPSAYAAVHRGELPSIRVGGRLLVPRASFERLLRGESSHGTAGHAPADHTLPAA